MQPLNSFYLDRLVGTFGIGNTQMDPYTLSFKFGRTQDITGRGIVNEFLNTANISTQKNPGLGKYDVTEQIHLLEVSGKYTCCVAPFNFIDDWETFVDEKFFDKSSRFFRDATKKKNKFGSKHEYLDPPVETENRVNYLVRVIKKYAPLLAELKPQYEELLKLTVPVDALLKRVNDEYKAIFDKMKRDLNNYGTNKKGVKKVTLPTPAQLPVPSPTTSPTTGPQKAFLTLDDDWTLVVFKGSTIYGLQHNIYHAKDDGSKSLRPTNKDFNVLLADSEVKSSRFQFHDNKYLSERYTPCNLSSSKVIEQLTKAGKVRNLSIADLPPKGKKMLKKKMNLTSLTITNK